MNLLTVVFICLTIFFHQILSQDSAFSSMSCDKSDVQQEIVNKHNDLRKNVKPSPSNMLKMTWNTEAATHAKNWAKKCTHAHSNADDRKISTSGCGENLYMANRLHSWNKAIQSWFDEAKDFNYGSGAKSTGAVVGHYTQLVWFSSHFLGCAVHFCPEKDLAYLYVCHYCPEGNKLKTLHSPYLEGNSCANCTHSCVNGLCNNPCLHNDTFDNCNEYADMCEEYEMVQENCPATCSCHNEIM
ncbi:hypothetical protein FKM82_017383 [Ascaphus truei]